MLGVMCCAAYEGMTGGGVKVVLVGVPERCSGLVYGVPTERGWWGWWWTQSVALG